MENIIKRKISLEPIRTRMEMKGDFLGNEKPREDGTIWGRIPYDVNFALLDEYYTQAIHIPTNKGIIYDEKGGNNGENYKFTEEKAVLRYGNFVYWDTWLTNFYRNTVFFKLGYNKDGLTWSEAENTFDFTKNNSVAILPSLPRIDKEGKMTDIFENEYSCGAYIGINRDYETFYKMFRNTSKNENGKITIGDGEYKIKEEKENRGELNFSKFEKKYKSGFFPKSTPYFDLPIYIESDIDSIGQFESIEEEWIPNKAYKDGDIVIYNGESHKLNLEEYQQEENEQLKVEITGDELIKALNLSADTEGRHFLYVKYIKEKTFNEKKLWDEYVRNPNTESKKPKNPITAQTESRLSSLRRTKISVDDDGNTLPFIVNAENKAELPFAVGCVNLYEEDENTNEYFADIIEKISFDNIKPYSCYNEDEGTETVINNSIITIDENFPVSGMVSFTYLIGAKVKIENGVMSKALDACEGVRYIEEYPFEKKDYQKIKYDGTDKTFEYVDIDFGYASSIIENEKLDNGQESVILSDIQYRVEDIIRDKLNEFNIIKNEATIGLEDVSKNIDGYVDRGASAAFERMNILSEINTFQDLNNYRNNLFEL